MSRTYDLLQDFDVDENSIEEIDSTAFAVIACWRYRYPATFSRSKQASFSDDSNMAVKLRDQVLIVVEDIRSLQIQHTKSNHVSSLSATFAPGANYLTELFPGDWMMAWIVHDQALADSLIKRIREGKDACNEFMDGLKFLGRCSSIRKNVQQAPGGIRSTTYSISAGGFQEMDAQLYYEPFLAATAPGTVTDWLRKTGRSVDNLIVNSDNSEAGGISINTIVPTLFEVFFGTGVPRSEGLEDVGSQATNAGLNNPTSFLVPTPVGVALGVSTGSKMGGKIGWNDVCEILFGVQNYQLSAEGTGTNAADVFLPDGIPTGDDTRLRHTPTGLLGIFLPSTPQFTGQRSVWDILGQYKNPAVNEFYTCLRVNPTGSVMPTFVCRQKPFSSRTLEEIYRPKPWVQAGPWQTVTPAVAGEWKDNKKQEFVTNPGTPGSSQDAPRQLSLTRFVELPRWRIHPALVHSVDLGRSDALRFNFIHVYPDSGMPTQDHTRAIVRDPPVLDELDIMRQGLRPYMQSVNCAQADAENRRAGDWMYILADQLQGQHLTLTGQIQMIGIQAPICPGDNVEWDEHILHIESVGHAFQQGPYGPKSFNTTLALTYGMKLDQTVGDDFSMFSGIDSGDLRMYESTTSREYRRNTNEPNSPPSTHTDTQDPGSDPTSDNSPHPNDEEANESRESILEAAFVKNRN